MHQLVAIDVMQPPQHRLYSVCFGSHKSSHCGTRGCIFGIIFEKQSFGFVANRNLTRKFFESAFFSVNDTVSQGYLTSFCSWPK